MSTDLFIDLHGLLLIRVVTPEKRLKNLLKTRLSHLLVNSMGKRRPALVIRAVDSLPDMYLNDRLPLQMLLTNDRQRWCAGLQKSGRPQVQLCPGPPVELHYIPGNTSMACVWWLLLIMLRRILMHSGHLLCHGAVLARNGHGLVIAGHRGQGKTTLTLRLLSAGWDYIAEDKFILANGIAHAFEQQLRLRPYHATLLDKASPLRSRLERLGRRNQRLLPLATPLLRLLPGELGDRLRSRIDRSVSVPMEQIDGTGLFVEKIPVSDVVLMRYAPDPAQVVTTQQGCMAFSQLQALAFAELHALDHLFDYYDNRPSQDLAALSLRNLADARFRCLDPSRPEDWQFLGEFR